MNILCCLTSSIDMSLFLPILTTCVTIIGSFIVWGLNEKSKRKQEIYNRKEERYGKLITSIKGFYANSVNPEMKNEFITQLNLCWMYCPDSIIIKGYSFLEMIHTATERKYSDEEKETALGDLILEIRKDLISNPKITTTELKSSDFKNYIST